MRPPQGFSSEEVAATVILASSHFGYPLSTTQVVSGAVTGSGVGRPGAQVDWASPGGSSPAGCSRCPPRASPRRSSTGSPTSSATERVGPIAVTVILAIACFFLWRANRAAKVEPDEVIAQPIRRRRPSSR